MFRRYLDPLLTVLLAPPDAAGSGGAAGSAAPGGSAADSGGTAGADEAAGDAGAAGDGDGVTDEGRPESRTDGSDVDEDDPDDPDHDLPPEIRNDPKRLRTRLRRLQRQFSTTRPIVERLRDRDGQLRDVDQLLGRARDMEELEQFFAENQDIVGQILERRTRGRAADPAEDAFQDPFGNLEAVPFDTSSESGRWFVDQFRTAHRTLHELRQQNKRLEATLQRVMQNDSTRTVRDHESRWKTQTIAAATKVPEHLRATFTTSVYRAFKLAERDGRLDRVDAARIIARELEPFLREARGRQRQAVAGQQRRAEGNRATPAPARGQTSPTDPNATNRAGTIRDSRKSFFARLGMSAPPSGR